MTLNNEKVLVELVASSTDSAEYREENYFPEYKYEDSAGSEYMFDNEELLTYYWNSNITKEGNSVSEKECVDIAEKFAQQIFNTSEYSRSVELEEWHGEKRYKVLYVKYIGGIETTDYAGIYINLNGEIIYYSAFMLNRIPLETDINSVDLDAATEAVKQRLDAMYENVKENYDRIEYSEPDFKLTVLKNGQKGLVTNVSVHCIEDLGAGFESRIGEELNIVVPLP